jgi:anti-sigma regulatory factor (Ser/Thr protein kinase)
MMTGLKIVANGLRVRLAAVPESVPEARAQVRGWCEQTGFCERTRDDLLLAVSEAVANVVVHAYPGRRQGTFSLEIGRDAGDVVISISDEGVGLSGAPASSGCGLGLAIIERMFPGSTFVAAEPGTHVTIRAPIA